MKVNTRREALKQGGLYLLGTTAACAAFPVIGLGCSQSAVDQEKAFALTQGARRAAVEPIRLTVVYDKIACRKGVRTDWRFACLVKGLDKNTCSTPAGTTTFSWRIYPD